MLLAQVHHLLYQPNQICVPCLVHTAMNGLRVVVKQVELQGNDLEWNLGSQERTSQKEYSMNIFQRKVMLIPLKMKLIIFLCYVKSPVLMNLLPTHMGDGKLALISFPNNHEDLELELQRFGLTLCNFAMSEKALESKPDIMFLMETQLVRDKGKDVQIKCGFFQGWEVPKEGLSGGLLLAWMPKQSLRMLHESKHLFHIDLVDNRGNSLSVTLIYGHPEHSKRMEVWQQLRSLKQIAHPNWLCIGDFNQVLIGEEKFSFNQHSIVGVDMFQQVIVELQLCDLAVTGQNLHE